MSGGFISGNQEPLSINIMDMPFVYVIMRVKILIEQMVLLQKGRQAINGFWGVPFGNCQKRFIHQFWHLLLRRGCESHNENADLSKLEYG